jgi:hypothetical protein
MAKKFYSFWNLLLGSFITLLGFGSCKTAKNVQQAEEQLVLYGPPPAEVIEKEEPVDRIRLLNGVPPVRRMEKVQE